MNNKNLLYLNLAIDDQDVSLGFGAHAHQALDYLIKEHGRIMYDCKPGDWERGKCKAPELPNTHQH